jgi:four helix bundle protein
MEENKQTKFHTDLRGFLDEYAHLIYDITTTFPTNEQFGLTSQLRRAAISVVLNYTEGYARMRKAVLKNFIEISYGSLKESIYLIEFTYKRKFMTETNHKKATELANIIAKMLWGMLKKL